MTAFLSDDWFEELTAAAATATPPADLELTIEQRITDGERWSVRIGGGRVEVARGAADDADVQVVTDAATAEGIRSGRLSAQRAFLDGTLRIGGDVAALIEHREQLAELSVGFA